MSTIIAMVAENVDLHGYSVHRLFVALSEDIGQQQLCKVAVWTMGEYGDMLLTKREDGQPQVCVCLYVCARVCLLEGNYDGICAEL